MQDCVWCCTNTAEQKLILALESFDERIKDSLQKKGLTPDTEVYKNESSGQMLQWYLRKGWFLRTVAKSLLAQNVQSGQTALKQILH